MHRIQLEINSNDIFDKVMFFLNVLPKNKVKLTVSHPKKPDNHHRTFEDFLKQTHPVEKIGSLDRETLHAR